MAFCSEDFDSYIYMQALLLLAYSYNRAARSGAAGAAGADGTARASPLFWK